MRSVLVTTGGGASYHFRSGPTTRLQEAKIVKLKIIQFVSILNDRVFCFLIA